MTNFSDLSFSKQKDFLDSIDLVLADCDGVLWRGSTRPGGGEVINKLIKMGKKVGLLSNNSYHSWENFQDNIKKAGIVGIEEEDYIFPANTVVEYLQMIGFKKKLFVSCSPPMMKLLDKAGYQYDTGANLDPADVAQQAKLDPDVGAVIVDSNPYRNYMSVAKTIHYLLKNPDTLFIVGATDKWAPLTADITIVGPGHFQELIMKACDRQPIVLGKPGKHLGIVLSKKYSIENPQRVLFIGDSMDQDIMFAQNQGYRNLLVLTGITDKETAESGTIVDGLFNGNDSEKVPVKAEFYLNSLTDLLPVLNTIML